MDPQDRGALTPPRPASAGLRVGLLGLGTVGHAVATCLLDEGWRADVSARGFVPPSLVAVAARDVPPERVAQLPDGVRLTDDAAAVVGAQDVDVVVELMGGRQAAGAAIREALARGRSVVSANKELLAREGRELETAARAARLALRFEGAVAGGVPVLGPLVRDLAADRLTAVRGIVNGTTNHILSTMAVDDREYADVLREAQARGYAEADPSSDVEGLDAAYKLTLLVRLAFGGWIDVESLRRTNPVFGGPAAPGITGVARGHLGVAARLGLALKLVARAERTPAGTIRGGVTVMAVALGSPLGATRGVTNLLVLEGQPVGRVSMSGPGAGGPATSSAVLADLLAISTGEGAAWGQLPPAGELAIADDLSDERGWMVVAEGFGWTGIPDGLADLVLVSTEDGFVTRPVSLSALEGRLVGLAGSVHAYPILSDA